MTIDVYLAWLVILALLVSFAIALIPPKPNKSKFMMRKDESWMGRYRDHKRRTTIHTIVNRLAGEAQPVKAALSFIQREEFPDVSFYQGLIDWARMRTKARKVIIRAGQNLWVDIRFVANYIGARLFGFQRGIYWFFDGRASPGAQAALLVGLIRDDKPELGVWIDWERNYGGAHEGLRNVVAMMQEVERLLPGVEVGLYSGYWFFRENSNPIWNAAQYAYLAKKKLWLAFYALLEKVLIPVPWLKMTYWQKGTPAVGKDYGTETEEIDMNEVMDGDPIPPQPEPEEPDMTLYGTVITTTTLAIRSGPGTNYEKVGDLMPGDKIEASEILGGWWKLTKITRGMTSPIINLGYSYANSGLYIRTDAPPTPPAPVPAGEIRLKEFTLTIVIDGQEYRKTLTVDVPLDAVG